MPVNLKRQAERIAKENRLPVEIFKALVYTESRWRVDAKSPAGARGLTQLMPATAKSLGVDPSDPIQALEGGARYLRQQLDKFGSMRLALAAYNAGPGAVEQYGGVPPYTETQRYVRDILQLAGNPKAIEPAQTRRLDVSTPLATSTSLIGPPAIGASTLVPDPAQVAFDNLGKIAQGGSPLVGLSKLVNADLAATAAQTAPEPPAAPDAPTAPTDTPAAPGSQPTGAPAVKPGGGWHGSEGVVKGLAAIALQLGLQVTSAKRDKRYTTTGNTSDHYSGNKVAYAEDLSNGYATPQMDKAAQRIAHALGVRWDGKGPLEITKIVDGYRIQVLYRTHTGGDHFTHIHVGAKRVS